MAMVSEFVAAVNQICAERGIDQEEVFKALESAVLSAYKKEFDKEQLENLNIELNRNTGEFKLVAMKTVAKKVNDADTEISLKEAQALNKKIKEGDTVEIELPGVDFGRIAAQTAKQVILQKINESERQAILDEYEGKVGQVFTALMQRMQRGQVVFEIGKATAFMPTTEQIPNEFYKIGERYKVLLKGIEDTTSGKVLIVSRADPAFLVELFKQEVPELDSGVVEVKDCAREAGSRSKMAVFSNQEGIDPIGSCVGQRGIRIANVMSDLGEEKIDIIEWNEDYEQYIANSLSPAKVESVKIKDDIAYVKVADDQLSLAIGREGQNVRLAFKLTGIKIDIQGNTQKVENAEDEPVVDSSDDAETTKETEEKDKKKEKKTVKKTKKVAKKATKSK
ncbi:MAG TPA: transcription termination factor NusA [Candidatus Dojkabacteria bacterium]|nr:transcription termination factor NusA [Candidatus Dojkabacteria bacterium]